MCNVVSKLSISEENLRKQNMNQVTNQTIMLPKLMLSCFTNCFQQTMIPIITMSVKIKPNFFHKTDQKLNQITLTV